jgi:RNA polymerase sigma-70 factor (ECF subfamily)
MKPARQRTLDLPDAELAPLIAAGDKDAFEALMRRYNQKLYRTARAILKDDAEAEDAVQEAYLTVYGSIGSFRGEAQLSTWLVRVTANHALMRLRKRKRTAEVIHLESSGAEHDTNFMESTMDEATHEQPENAAARAETRRLLEAAIDRLPETFRAVFVLRGVEEMPVEEVAAALGIPEATVRTRFFRARSLLRESLARELDLALEDAFAFAGERCDRIVVGVLARIEP